MPVEFKLWVTFAIISLIFYQFNKADLGRNYRWDVWYKLIFGVGGVLLTITSIVMFLLWTWTL